MSIKSRFSNVENINCGVARGSILGRLLFLLYVNDMLQNVDCDLFLDMDHSCLVYQHSDVKEIGEKLKNLFSNVCDWFVDNKLYIRFGEDKTKCILFESKKKLNKENSHDIRYETIHIEQCYTVAYLGCGLDKELPGESMVLKVI